ncbi:unnamed protein product, partial [Iphiclides podalirius]
MPRYLRDGFYPEVPEQQQARFAWTEEDGNIASLVSDPGFGTTGQTTFGKDLDVELKTEMKEEDTTSSVFQASNRNAFEFLKKTQGEPPVVSSTSTAIASTGKCNQSTYKIDKADPRSRYHYVKYVKRHGRTVKLWECGIYRACKAADSSQYIIHTTHLLVSGSREFQHQYTLMRHLPTHTDERNFHCSACGKSFRQLSTLSQHRAIHSAERPYSCEAHPDESSSTSSGSGRNVPRVAKSPITRGQADSTRSPSEHCEVSSTVGPYPGRADTAPTAWTKELWPTPRFFPEPIDAWCFTNPWGGTGTGVVVDPIKTYHMGVALATKQTPFALLKPEKGAPVLVKVVDTKLPGGKQMLVPATAEDLRDGGKIIMKNDGSSESQGAVVGVGPGMEGALQIRVPVVATVVPRIQPGGRLRLSVEEPHRAYHTALSTEAGEINVDPCTGHRHSDISKTPSTHEKSSRFEDHAASSASCISSSCTFPPPAPSPPLDLIPMDLFEPMECLPMGPQITAVDNVHQPPGSDDSDIFIGTFEAGPPARRERRARHVTAARTGLESRTVRTTEHISILADLSRPPRGNESADSL